MPVAVVVLTLPLNGLGMSTNCGNAIQAATASRHPTSEPDVGAACRRLGHQRVVDVIWIVVGGAIVSGVVSRFASPGDL